MPDTAPDQPKGSQNRRDAYDKANTYILAATLIAAGCAAGFTGWQAWIARDQEHRALRAYVLVNAELQRRVDNAIPSIKLSAENMGQTPVYNLTFNTWNSAIEGYKDVAVPSFLAIDCRAMFPIGRMGSPGITFSKTTNDDATGLSSPAENLQTWDEVFRKFTKVVVYGTVCYRDVFNDPHSVRVCFEWSDPDRGPRRCRREDANDQDY